jgi:hypothetical protein
MLVDVQPNSFAVLVPLGPSLRARSAAARDAQVVYLTIGSQNQDDRSLFGTGEVLAVISGDAVLAGITDYVYLVARATGSKPSKSSTRFSHRLARCLAKGPRWMRGWIWIRDPCRVRPAIG